MATTIMRTSTNTEVFHRFASDVGDMPAHDISTIDTVAQGMGGTADFEIEADETVVHLDGSAKFSGNEAIAGIGAITKYIYIKHTGFTTSSKLTVSNSLLKIGIGDAFDTNGGFSLSPGEAITLHGLSSANNNLNKFFLDPTSTDIYVEIKYL